MRAKNTLFSVIYGVTGMAAAADPYLAINEPTLPGSQAPMYETTLLPDGGGFYPTENEFSLLRGADNSRSAGGALNQYAPDLSLQSASGIFPYSGDGPNFYRRNPWLFKNMDHLLGFMTPNDAFTVESHELQHTAFTLDANTGLLTRTFSPELATLKAGPIYLDLLWLGAGAVWSDYNGAREFGPENGDGIVSYIDVGFRALVRLTDTIYLSTAGMLMYLPQTNEIAFALAYGNQASLGVDLVFADTWGDWDVSVSNHFLGRPGLNFYANAWDSGSDRAGRYWYGIQQQRANTFNDFASENYAFFVNTLGANASRRVFGGAWRFWAGIDRSDFWKGFNLSNHSKRDHLGLILGYEGSVLPFAPKFSYDIWSFDGYETQYHQIMAGLTGRLTENIDWAGNVGYLYKTGDNNRVGRFLWNTSITHHLTAKTSHNLSLGETFLTNDLTNDALTSRYISYSVAHHFARNLQLAMFAQVSDRENVINGTTRNNVPASSERAGGGANLIYRPLDFTVVTASILHDRSIKPQDAFNRWISRIQVTQQLSLRFTANLLYQYEESSFGSNGFTEHMVQFGLRRYF